MASPVAPQEPVSVRTDERKNLGCAYLFCTLFIVAGLAAFFFAFVQPVLQIRQAQSWPSGQCTITSSDIGVHRGDSTSYSFDVQYTYRVGTRQYSGQRYDFSPSATGSYSAANSLVQQYPRGAVVPCYVDPGSPSNAVLNRNFNGEMWLGALPLIFTAVGLLLLVVFHKNANAARDPRSKWKPDSHSGPSDAGSVARHGTVAPGGKSFHSPQPSGPTVLKSRNGTPLARAIGLFFISAFWNGITLFMCYQFLFKSGLGLFTIFVVLFFVPFLAIGLGMAILFVGQTLSIFNARPTLTLSRPTLRPGESVSINWNFGSGFRPHNVHIWVEGREEASFRRGTDTITEKGLFFRQELHGSQVSNGNPNLEKVILRLIRFFSKKPLAPHEAHFPVAMDERGLTQPVPGPAAALSGHFTLEIPAGLMHSFEATHNKIYYVVGVRGSIPRWPDTDEEFTLVVTPAVNRGHLDTAGGPVEGRIS